MNKCSMLAVYVPTFWAASVAFFLQVVASTPASVASCRAAASFDCYEGLCITSGRCATHEIHCRFGTSKWV